MTDTSLDHGAPTPAPVWPLGDQVCFRHATPRDGIAMWRLRRHVAGRSPYGYFALLRHLASSSVVAERDGELVGFVIARRQTDDNVEVIDGAVDMDLLHPTALFVEMLGRLLGFPAFRGASYVDASNGCDQGLKQALLKVSMLPLAKCVEYAAPRERLRA